MESSFPIVEQPLTDQQWGQVTEGFGSGILAKGSEPYGIPSGGIDNSNNTVRFGGRGSSGEGRAVVSGFFHRYDADLVLSVPAVTTTTTYYLGLTYDPTKHAAASGPVSVTVTTAPPSGGGKVYLPIYEIVRSPNQMLSDATIRDRRAFIAPNITVKGQAALPPATSLLTYTVATDWETGQQWQVHLDGTWKRIGGTYVVPTLTMAGWTILTSGVMVTPLPDGSAQAVLDVELRRSGATFTQGDAFIVHGTLLPTSVRAPGRDGIYLPAQIGTSSGVVYLDMTTGQVQARLWSGSTSMTVGRPIAFQASWRIPA